MKPPALDAVVVGGGPNGLAAAITLLRAGRSVQLFEARETLGGGCRSDEPFGPGILVDHCSAVHPLGRSSPVFRELELERHGLTWIEPEVQVGHPFDDGAAVLLTRDIERTVDSFRSRTDAARYASWMAPVAARWERVVAALLGPLRPRALLADPLTTLLAGPPALLPAAWVARLLEGPRSRALLAGAAAHSFLPLERPLSAAFGLYLLASAHAVGWPLPQGGAQALTDALASVLREAGGRAVTGHHVASLEDLPASRVRLLDLAPRGVLDVVGQRLPLRDRRALGGYRYGPAAFKVDYLLDRPIPWQAVGLAGAGTIHLGGRYEEIAASERAVAEGRVHERPFVILTQPTQQDPSRSPAGRHVVWAYCHVPNGWPGDASEAISAQVERFAPGFREAIVDRRVTRPADLEAFDPNFVGGDINAGLMDWRQFLTRPMARRDPYATGHRGTFICSASTPPGGGVHGLCGAFAARSALRALGATTP